MKRETHEREDDSIERLCAVLSELDGHPVAVTSREGKHGGCDAIVTRGDSRVAVEHTRVHTTRARPGHVRVLEQITPPISDRVLAAFPKEWILVLVPVEKIETGTDWGAVCERIAAEVIAAVPGIKREQGLKIDLPGLFQIVAFRHQPHGSKGYCWVKWWTRSDEERQKIVDDVSAAIRRKRPKLIAYRTDGYRTLLLLDAEEAGWPAQFINAFAEVIEHEPLDAFDEVYLACTGLLPIMFVPLKLGAVVMPKPAELQEFWNAEKRVMAARGEWA